MPQNNSPTPELDALLRQEPDLVDRIFDYLVEQLPQLSPDQVREIERRVRDTHGGQENYVRKDARVRTLSTEVLAIFNGRNATEVARRLRISRATVYRHLKQAGRQW